jgi:hypothetical protein
MGHDICCRPVQADVPADNPSTGSAVTTPVPPPDPWTAPAPATQPANAPGRPSSAPPTPETARAARNSLVAGIVSLGLAVSIVPLALVTGGVALWLGRKTVRLSRAAGSSTPGQALAGMAMGAGGLVVAALILAVLALIWPQFSSYRECIAGANTGIAQTACQNQFKDAITQRFGGGA